ncbi:MAG: selenocysteine-specific translation elongation factor [Candidatus Lokiarchaeota archaeon]|nr:selenocysteine-specific translation elongation factor [Candidatus Lokiarchaeota archaeon]
MDKIPVHIAIVGHIDHGKTKLSETLTELVSTAGLDKHPQSKEKGITIDIGFSFFNLNEYQVTLVDAPGHADLIRSVVAASSIADGAILVIDANEGPKVQTGEHVLILESFNIHNIVIALNKIDLINNSEKLNGMVQKIKNLLKNTSLKDAPIVPISAKTKEGIDKLKTSLYKVLKKPVRETDGAFKMPIDHHFPIKGIGTVFTGTVHRGKMRIGQEVEIMPIKIKGKIKSIQIMKENKSEVEAGYRVGIAISGIDPNKISRGYYLCSPNSLKAVKYVIIKCKINDLYPKSLKPQMSLHLTIGMPTVSGLFFPFIIKNDKKILLEEVKNNEEFFAYIKLNEIIAVEKNDPVLISRLDLPPTSLRIVASGKVAEILTDPIEELYRLNLKVGTIKDLYHRDGVIVQGLAQSKIGADKFKNKIVRTSSNIEGTIINSFGTKGLVIARFYRLPKESEEIFLEKIKRYKI